MSAIDLLYWIQMQDITRLLGELREGSLAAESLLIAAVYPELKKIAGGYLKGERRTHSLQPTALVNEAYLQLAGQLDKDWKNRSHFFAVAALLMRRILVDHARSRKAQKRDGGWQRVELTDVLAVEVEHLEEILAIDAALNRLAEFDKRQCRIVELRFFGGLKEQEIAAVLKISTRTVKREWNVARAWLHSELRAERASSQSA